MTWNFLPLLLLLLAMLPGRPLAAQATQPSAGGTEPAPAPVEPGRAVVIEFRGEVNDFSRDALFRRFEEARESGVQTVILKINTYGGLVTAALDISRFLKQQDDLQIIAFINEKAISAGAMIALACDQIVMEPNALLGDCAPITVGPGGGAEPMPTTERAKAESPILEDFYDSAIENGYDPLLVQAMVAVDRTVYWIENDKGERRFVDADTYEKLIEEKGWHLVEGVRNPVDGPDTLLTVNTERALALGIAEASFLTVGAMAQAWGLQITQTLEPTLSERLVGWLSSMAVRSVLLIVLMVAGYMALSTPGHGGPEAAAVIALGLMLGIPLLTGYAQWWEIITIVVGFGLLVVELFVLPGFGVPGISGIIMILLGLTMTFVGDEPVELPGILPSLEGTWDALKQGLLAVVVGMAASLFLWYWLSRYLPKLPYMNRLVLAGSTGEQIAVPQPATESKVWPAVGAEGRAVTDLRPGGEAEFRDDSIDDTRIIDVVSDIGFVRAETPVKVRAMEGGRVVVRPS